MKFQTKLSGLLVGLQPAIVAATTGAKKDYDDSLKIAITAKGNDLLVEANNGNVAVSNSVASINGIDFKPDKDGTVTVKANDFASMLGAYSTDDNVTLEIVANELVVSLVSDPEENSSIPAEARSIVMPSPPTTYSKEVEINRATLTNAMKKVLFAVGDEKYRPHFLYWVLRVRNDGFRLAAGDGARFSVYEIAGANVVKSKDEFSLLVSKEHNAVLQKLLDSSSTDSVLIREAGNDPQTAQTALTFDSITMTLIGHDPGTKWPDEDKFLKRVSPIKYTTSLTDWAPVLKGVVATYNEAVRQQNQIHHCSMQFESGKGNVLVKADHFMKTSRKVKIRGSEKPEDGMSFICLSRYMAEVQKFGDAGDGIQMEFVDDKQPVVIRFFAGDKVSDGPIFKTEPNKNTREQHVIFIASVNRAQQAAAAAAKKNDDKDE